MRLGSMMRGGGGGGRGVGFRFGLGFGARVRRLLRPTFREADVHHS